MKKGLLLAVVLVVILVVYLAQSGRIDNTNLPFAGQQSKIDRYLRDDLLAHLRAQNYEKLDTIYQGYANKYDQDEITESEFDWVVSQLELIDPSLEPLMLAWVEASQSWASRLVLARYLNQLSWQWRGGSFAHLVPQENMAKFRELQSRARKLVLSARQGNKSDSLSYALAITLLNQSGGNREERAIEIALEKFPESREVYYAAIHAQHKNWGGDEFKRQSLIYDVTELIEGPNHDSSATSYYYEALANAESKNYQAAIKAITKAIQIDPERTGFYYQSAKYHEKTERYESALEDINKYLEKNPLNTGALYLRAEILLELGRSKKATKDMELALKYSAFSKNYNVFATRLYGGLEQKEKAKAAIERGLYFSRHNPDDIGRLAFQAKYAMKDFALAEELYKSMLDLDELHVGAHYGLATLYGEQESCNVVEHVYQFLLGCKVGARKSDYWCEKKYTNWGYGAVNYLQQHQKCPAVNDYDFSYF